jgi:predicted phage terminase large subunit-like protein
MKFTNPEWLKTITNIETIADDWQWMRVWDLAATEDGGDYMCGSLCGYSKKTSNFVIGNVIRKQLGPGQVEEQVRKTAVADGEHVKIGIEQEPGSSGKSLVNHYQVNVLREFEVIAVPATKSKLIRAQPFLAAAEAGKVFLLDEEVGSYEQVEGELSWHKIFKGEFETFPNGQQDDQIDTAAAGYNALSGKKVYSVSWGRSKQTEQKLNSRGIRQASFIAARSGQRSSIAFGRTIRSKS